MSASLPNSLPQNADSFSTGPGSFVGKRVGPYTICLELASGGMATVFLARRGSGENAGLVALKIIHHHLAERRDFVEMFADEANISSQIRHHNVCEVYGFDKVSDSYYLAMEYLMGEALSAVFRRTARRTTDLGKHADLVVRVIADACAGLHAAHTLTDAKGKPLNVVHRDISPENLFVTYAGVTKVVDFGLACAKHKTHRTRTGTIKGKFGYVCPEALTGAKVDHRADIWGLGVVIWEALTGRRLFRGNTDAQTLTAVSQAVIEPPSLIRPGLPRKLDRVVLRALSRDPALRQSSVLELARELLEACPAARGLGEPDVADWMAALFNSERRWKSQVIELVQTLSRPDHAVPEIEFDAALTRVKTPSSLARPPRRRKWVSGAATVLALVATAAVARLLPPIERADAHELPAGPVAVEALAAPVLESSPQEPEVAAAAEVSTEALDEGTGYVLEIVKPTPGKKGLVVRIKPEKPKQALAAEAAAEAAPQQAAAAEDKGGPPVWLRRVMEPERPADLMDPWPVSARPQPPQAAVNTPEQQRALVHESRIKLDQGGSRP